MRTQEQISADLEKRFEEIEREAKRRAKDPRIQMPCATCRWGFNQRNGKRFQKCKEPLVIGFSEQGWAWAFDCNDGTVFKAKLCGPEKALWQPKLSWWQRFLEFFS